MMRMIPFVVVDVKKRELVEEFFVPLLWQLCFRFPTSKFLFFSSIRLATCGLLF
ncbi:hypothetical protein Hanom_Chr09g00836611 [Helianthus anomalus]